jgi:hypothetical protein
MRDADGLHPLWDPGLDQQLAPVDQYTPLDPHRNVQPLGIGGGRTRSSSDDLSPIGSWGDRDSVQFSMNFGIIVPIVCLVLDPFVFKLGDEHGPMFGEYRLFAYSFVGLEIIALATWLVAGERLGSYSGIVAGVLLAGSAFAALVGVVLLPLTVLGLLCLIGLLGLAPFLTANVYLRQAGRAVEAARSRLGPCAFVFSPILGMVLAVGLPTCAHIGVQWGWEAAVRDVSDGQEMAEDRARFWYRLLPPGGSHIADPLDRAIDQEKDPIRKRRLVEARDNLLGL